jgi:hypothetical protein
MTDLPQSQILDFYRAPSAMQSAGAHAAAFRDLPDDIASLAGIVQGVLLHQHIAPAYGETLTSERISEAHIRPVSALLDRVLKDGPLAQARPPAQRTIAVCRHFSLLLESILRAKGIPARARCGFGAYFDTGKFVDHWVTEYWHAGEARWVMVDAQLDDTQKKLFHIDFDTLDVPRDCFVIAGDAWRMCRDGRADPSAFGIMQMQGLWFIAGNIVRDVAALNNVEMLPWDVWGAMLQPDEAPDAAALKRFDHLAALTHDPDAHFGELRALYAGDNGLAVPATVFNAVLNRAEQL